MGLDLAIRIPVIATEIVITVLPTMDTVMDAGIMAMAIKVVANVEEMVEHRVEPTEIEAIVRYGYE